MQRKRLGLTLLPLAAAGLVATAGCRPSTDDVGRTSSTATTVPSAAAASASAPTCKQDVSVDYTTAKADSDGNVHLVVTTCMPADRSVWALSTDGSTYYYSDTNPLGQGSGTYVVSIPVGKGALITFVQGGHDCDDYLSHGTPGPDGFRSIQFEKASGCSGTSVTVRVTH